MTQTVLEFFISKFEGETVTEFIDNVQAHIQENEETIEEWEATGVDELSIKCQEEYIEDITSKHKIFKGIMTYNEVVELKNHIENKGLICENIFNKIEFKKAEIENLKEQFIAEWVEEDEEFEMVNNMQTMKEVRAFLKTNPMGNDWVVYNKHFYSCMNLTN